MTANELPESPPGAVPSDEPRNSKPKAPSATTTRGAPRTVGVLAEKQLIAACGRGQLISGNYDASRISGISYEVRASSEYFDFTSSGPMHRTATDLGIIVRPHQMVSVVSLEELDVPLDYMGHVVAKGKLFSLGLIPVNMWIDPGFRGRLGLVLYNATMSYIRIPSGFGIAKVEFSRLSSAARKGYSGQYGVGDGSWPAARELVLSEKQILEAGFGDSMRELHDTHGAVVADLATRVFKYERYLLGSIIASVFLMLVLVGASSQGHQLNLPTAVGLGVAANALTGVLTLAATKMPGRRRP